MNALTEPEPSPLVSSDWLAEQLGDPRLLVLDATVCLAAPDFDGDYRAASGRAQWLAGHIPGAVHADLLGSLSDASTGFGFSLPAAPELAESLKQLGVGDTSRLVLYDSEGGIWAARLWWMLRSLGLFAQVLDGGWRTWQAQQWPIEQGARPAVAAQALTVNPQSLLWADKAQVQALLTGVRQGTLVCALGAAVFTGQAATRYSRRGHIPQSLNLPARKLVDAQGRYLPLDQLRRELQPLLVQEALLLYCGGGIAACALALVLTLLGHQRLAVYDGSLQEWSADPDLSMLTGE